MRWSARTHQICGIDGVSWLELWRGFSNQTIWEPWKRPKDFETHLEWSWNDEDVTLRLKLLVDEGMKGGEFTQRYMFWKPMPVAIVYYFRPKRAFFSSLRLKHSPSVVLGWARWWGSGSSNPQQTILLHIATSAQVSPWDLAPFLLNLGNQPTTQKDLRHLSSMSSVHLRSLNPSIAALHDLPALFATESLPLPTTKAKRRRKLWSRFGVSTFRDWGMTSGWVPNDDDLVVGFQIDS